jgi:WhiB family redox-sensing transcriptional regulator
LASGWNTSRSGAKTATSGVAQDRNPGDGLQESNRDDHPARSPVMRPSTAWADRAACRGLDLALFFPERSESAAPGKRICRDCPVRMQCLVAGMPERHGTWGGLTRNERTALRRKARQARAA